MEFMVDTSETFPPLVGLEQITEGLQRDEEEDCSFSGSGVVCVKAFLQLVEKSSSPCPSSLVSLGDEQHCDWRSLLSFIVPLTLISNCNDKKRTVNK